VGTQCSILATGTARADPAADGSAGSATHAGIEQWVPAFRGDDGGEFEAQFDRKARCAAPTTPHSPKVIPAPATSIKLPPSPHRSEIMTSGWCGGTGWSGSRSGPGQSSDAAIRDPGSGVRTAGDQCRSAGAGDGAGSIAPFSGNGPGRRWSSRAGEDGRYNSMPGRTGEAEPHHLRTTRYEAKASPEVPACPAAAGRPAAAGP
jgi:hypothetical protein